MDLDLPPDGEWGAVRAAVVHHHGETVSGGRLDRPQDLRSATKSITAVLVLQAVERGELRLDDSAARWLGLSHPDPRFEALTVDHLLTMRSGLACDDHDPSSPGHEDRMYRRRDWVAFWASQAFEGDPGAEASYCTGNLVALGRILRSATGLEIPELARQRVFAPLGVTRVRWERWNRGRDTDTGGHLHLLPGDLATVGVALEDGRLLSPGGLALLWTETTRLDGRGYGRGWWRAGLSRDGRIDEVWYAHGNGGQLLFVAPTLDLVAAFTGGAYDSPESDRAFAWLGGWVASGAFDPAR